MSIERTSSSRQSYPLETNVPLSSYPLEEKKLQKFAKDILARNGKKDLEKTSKKIIYLLTHDADVAQKFKSNKAIQEKVKVILNTYDKKTLKENLADLSHEKISSPTNTEELLKSLNRIDKAKIADTVIAETERKKIAAIQKLSEIEDVKGLERIELIGPNLSMETLKKNEFFIAKLIHKLVHLFSKRTNFIKLFDVDFSKLTETEKESYKQAVETLKKLRLYDSGYYKSDMRLKNNKILRQAIHLAEEKMGFVDTLKPPLKPLFKFSEYKESFSGILLTDILAPGIFASDSIFFNTGGRSFISTELEFEALKALCEEDPLNEELNHFFNQISRSYDINKYINQNTNNDNNIEGVAPTAKLSFSAINSLKKNETLHLDLGYLQHAMRGVVSKNSDGSIEIKLFDTSGALESSQNNFFRGIVQFIMGKKQNVALTVTISEEVFKEQGQAYLEQLFEFECGYRRQENEYLSIPNHTYFMRIFKSLKNKKQLSGKQHTQVGMNCYFKRVDAAQRYYLSDINYINLRKQQMQIAFKNFVRCLNPNQKKIALNFFEELNQNQKFNLLSPKEFKSLKKALMVKKMPESDEEIEGMVKIIHFQNQLLDQELKKLEKSA